MTLPRQQLETQKVKEGFTKSTQIGIKDKKQQQSLIKGCWARKKQSDSKSDIKIKDKGVIKRSYELKYLKQGYKFVAGVDEAGRGPWAGPVVAAAVILPEDFDLEGIQDSKLFTKEDQREDIRDQLIVYPGIQYAIGTASVEEIDKENILQATYMAMTRAILQLKGPPEVLLIDGTHVIKRSSTDGKSLVGIAQEAIKSGDRVEKNIAAASIIAKVHRDELMRQYHQQYPQYHFDKHKGYGTELHSKMLKEYGVTKIHRTTYKPIQEIISQQENKQ